MFAEFVVNYVRLIRKNVHKYCLRELFFVNFCSHILFACPYENKYVTCKQVRVLCLRMTGAVVEVGLTDQMIFIVPYYFLRTSSFGMKDEPCSFS